jgi:hypothetical protein
LDRLEGFFRWLYGPIPSTLPISPYRTLSTIAYLYQVAITALIILSSSLEIQEWKLLKILNHGRIISLPICFSRS